MAERRCRSCLAPIRFLRLESGRAMPVDREPSALNGNVLVERGVARVLSTAAARDARARGYELYVPHFATCPGAASHRRGRAPEEPPREQPRQAFGRFLRGQGAARP